MKVAFVHIPKTGGASIYRWWHLNFKDSDFQIIRNQHLFLNSITEPYDTSFTITRNTYDKLISLYVFQKFKCHQKIRKGYNVSWYENILNIWNKGIIYYLKYSLENNFNGVTSQLDYIDGVEHIFSTENLKNDFKKIQKWANTNVPLTIDVHVQSYNKRDFMTPEYIKFVETHFSKEIEYFNYSPNL